MPNCCYLFTKGILCLALVLGMKSVQAQQVKIGVISDFEETSEVQSYVEQIIAEADQTTGPSRQISLGASAYGISDVDAATKAYQELSSQTGIILALGSLSAKGISDEDNLQTPVIALGVIDPFLQKLPIEKGMSGKNNFTYIWQTRNLDEEINAFSEVYDFKNLVVFADAKSQPTIDEDKAFDFIDHLSNKMNSNLTVIPVGDNIQESIDKIPEEADAAYFTVLIGRPVEELKSLINHLNDRKIPTFSGSSRLIDHGVLGSLANKNDRNEVIRKLAIMVDDMLSGSNLSTMPVALDSKENFYLNIATARKIELPIPFSVLFSATIVNDDQELKTYSFEEIADKAIKANLNISISYFDLELSGLNVKSVRSNLLPSLDAGLTGSQINEERASAAFNTPERSLTADLTLSQVIYSEQAIAGLKISKYLQKAQEYGTQAQILDVLLETYSSYINVLAAKTNVRIQQENLQKTKRNRELAEIRVNLGASNNADLYRWEAELASANQFVIDAQTNLLEAKIQLNQLLANTLEYEYDVEDISLEDDLFEELRRDSFGEVLNTPESLQKASDFLVMESQKNNPNKKSLLENINASKRQLQQNKRLLYVPTVALTAQTSQFLARGGEGTELEPSFAALGLPGQQDNSWFVGVSVSYPILTGFQRNVAVQQAKVGLEQLNDSRILLDQTLELNIRSTMLNLLSAGTNIDFSKKASASALKNFELIQENYKQGRVTITQVIDAQQAALEADLGAALSVYQYINTHLQLQYIVGSFMTFETEEKKQDFKNRMEQYIINQD